MRAAVLTGLREVRLEDRPEPTPRPGRVVEPELVERVVRRAEAIRIGDPVQPETEMGPLATTSSTRRC